MVKGIEQFKAYFAAFPDNYIIIGGTACDMIIEDEGLVARATKDIDIILVIEALNQKNKKKFWQQSILEDISIYKKSFFSSFLLKVSKELFFIFLLRNIY